MCGLFYMWEFEFRKLLENYDEIDSLVQGIAFDHDFHPGELAAVITGTHDKTRVTVNRWGYPGFSGKGVIFNARSETVFDKKMFQNGIKYNRCIIPACGFYEWNKHKDRYTFTQEDHDVMYLAGFHDYIDHEERFVILTREANASMSPVHDRMPVILEEDQISSWLFDENQTKLLMSQKAPMLLKETEREQLTLF